MEKAGEIHPVKKSMSNGLATKTDGANGEAAGGT
jgi:hypothetical protein